MDRSFYQSLIIALVPALVSLTSGMVIWVQGRATHEIVNSQRTVMLAEIENLKSQVLILLKSLDSKVAAASLTEPPKTGN